jgi:hypothetical protein
MRGEWGGLKHGEQEWETRRGGETAGSSVSPSPVPHSPTLPQHRYNPSAKTGWHFDPRTRVTYSNEGVPARRLLAGWRPRFPLRWRFPWKKQH